MQHGVGREPEATRTTSSASGHPPGHPASAALTCPGWRRSQLGRRLRASAMGMVPSSLAIRAARSRARFR
jgi:hypothetical protein